MGGTLHSNYHILHADVKYAAYMHGPSVQCIRIIYIYIYIYIYPWIARVSKTKIKLSFLIFWPHPGPGHVLLDSGRRDVEFANVFASVASLALSFVTGYIFWNPVEVKSFKGCPSNGGIYIQERERERDIERERERERERQREIS